MWPFNFGEELANYPRKWSDMSFEFKGMFVYHGAMMALFAVPMVFRQILRIPDYLFAAAAIAVVVAVLSWIRRKRLGWHWRGVGWKEITSLIILTLMFALFIVAPSPVFPPPPAMMPWYLAGLGIYALFALKFLRVVHFAEADFRAECGDAALSPRPEPPREVRWKRVVRATFSIYFLAVWLTGLAFFYVDIHAFRDGALSPVAEQTWPLTEHGVTHYVTKEEHERVELLKALFFIGVPSAILGTFFLQFVLGIPMGWRGIREK